MEGRERGVQSEMEGVRERRQGENGMMERIMNKRGMRAGYVLKGKGLEKG